MSGVPSRGDVLSILERARWAPSGDNAQPWRFRLLDEGRLEVTGTDTSAQVLYDYHGEATLVALGALVETVRLAAGAAGYTAATESLKRESGLFRVAIGLQSSGAAPDPLHHWIESRTTQRRPLKARVLASEHVDRLRASLPHGFELVLRAGWRERWRMACLLWWNAGIRLTTPEAYPVHRDAIEWGVTRSADRIPDAAVGMDPVGLAMMRWAMRSWRRVDILNRYFGGTVLPRVQLDLLPALFCGAHFLLLAPAPPNSDEDHLAAGAAMQRLWLQAAALGIQFQPGYTPLVFHRYARSGERFTTAGRPWQSALRLADHLDDEFGEDALSRAVFMGRLGYGPAPAARSTRLPLEQLLTE